MTLDEQYRLSFYTKIADISTHNNVCLVQHVENKRIFVRKEQEIYCKEVYEYLKSCNNPHIPHIYECIEDGKELVIIEEYIQGESLAEHLEGTGVFTPEEVCRFMIIICDVLEQLHHLPKPVIHRDLKPENILIQENGYLKIIDFNTAKQYEQGSEVDTVIIGTRKYAAPEQFGFRQSDTRTDIYAMGVMMNELLTKKYPDEYLYHEGKFEKCSLSNIISKCIEFSPDDRYQTVMDLRKDLQVVLARLTKGDLTSTDNIEKKTHNKKGRWNLPFLPPGFRTGVFWKMILGGMGYLFIFSTILSMEFTNPDGSVLIGFYLWANRIISLIWILLSIAFYADYLGIRRNLPLMQRRYLRFIGYILWPIIFIFILVLILVLIGG